MVINRASLVDAISGALSLAHGEFAGRLLSQLEPGDEATMADTGRVIAAVLAELPDCTAFESIEQMVLVGADCLIRGERVRVVGETALAHPSLAGWVHSTVGDQIARHLAYQLDPASVSNVTPVLTGIGALQIGTALACFVVDLEFPAVGVVASLQFGNWMEPAAHRVMREMHGATLAKIGAALRDDATPPNPPPPTPPGAQATHGETLH